MPFDHFGFIAPCYNKVAPYVPGASLLAALDLPVAGTLLDLGGGTGRVAVALAAHTRRTIVADVSPRMLSFAEQKGFPCVAAPAERLPFPDGAIERILMVDAFHHLENQRQAALEMLRVLRHGGRLVIVEPDIRFMDIKLIAIAEKLLWMRSHFLRADALVSLFNPGLTKWEQYRDRSSYILVFTKS
jgi:demethylmenaquinone methyltransferase/2-methoxy-6-polyprenyl-1,4-benzoquinol methylase